MKKKTSNNNVKNEHHIRIHLTSNGNGTTAAGIGNEESKISKTLDESLHKYELMMRNYGSVVFLPSINYALCKSFTYT